ncbi:MAG: hypothetical protein FJZ15_07860 [Candidatus Omnitrophica bacterium]|nr:hypothetical protein [Candidatus Omnitrophota bacterium]
MGKPLADEVSITLKRVHEAGIKTNTLWIVGYPTETMLDFLKTLLFLFKNRKHIDEFVNVSMCYIPQNSILQKQSEMLGIKYDNCGNWYIDKRRNNHAVRKRRAFFIKLFAKSIGLYKGGIRRDN